MLLTDNHSGLPTPNYTKSNSLIETLPARIRDRVFKARSAKGENLKKKNHYYKETKIALEGEYHKSQKLGYPADKPTISEKPHGEPPEDSGIRIVTTNRSFSYLEPECALFQGVWYYNWAGAMQLAKVLNKKLPHIPPLVYPLNGRLHKSQIQYQRNPSTGEFQKSEELLSTWCDVDVNKKDARYFYYNGYNGRKIPTFYACDKRRGLPVHFLSK